MKMATTAMTWIKSLRVLIFRVLSLENLRIRMMPTATIIAKIDRTRRGEFSVTIYFFLRTIKLIDAETATVPATTAAVINIRECC